MFDYARARQNMVTAQLETNGVSANLLLDVYLTTPREVFVPDALAQTAYLDEDQMAPNGQYTLEPLIEARMLQEALYGAEQWGENGADNVLFLGCNALPAAAMLAQLCAHIHLLCPDDASLKAAIEKFAAQNITNITPHMTDCESGLPDNGPFDAIILPGSTAHIPDILLDQLAENGRFVCVHRPSMYEPGRLICITRLDGDRFTTHYIADASTFYAPEFAPKAQFAF